MTVPICNLERQSHLAEGRRARALTLALGCLLIPLWQYTFYRAGDRLDARYRLQASTGKLMQEKFVYFLYYLGLFPVATEKDDVVFSREGAREVLAKHGDTLLMEWQHSYRSGSLGTALLYLPDALLRGSPKDPSVRPANGLAFTLALVGLFAAFWFIRQPVLGSILVLLLGSNPFQLHEAYLRENTFGWPITAAVALLALHVPLLGERKVSPWYLWAVPVASGLLLASVRQVRPEPLALILSPMACYLAVSGARWLVRVGLVGVLFAAYLLGGWGWSAWFDAKHEQARRAVAAAGGHPYPGPRAQSHLFWHPIWCGLGDFGQKHGYAWDDQAAADYALPLLEEKYGVEIPKTKRTRSLFKDTYWDEGRHYYKTPYELPHYEEVVRDKVLGDIARDPLWYLGVLAQRAWRILWQTTPPRLSVGTAGVDVPMHGVLVLPVLALLAARQCWWLLKLVCFSLPLSLPAFAIFSGLGMCHYSCYHLVVVALGAAWLLEATLRRWSRPRRAAARNEAGP
ncbi:MAG TPA: hypothetical protein VNE39_19275 [Planctomycetota bacterium]|nr:hypothetical protein [Planctomycetota bacterium]